jgi:hypothetical protein
MGGLGGHVDHLYDNPDLSFTDMIKIMQAASNGEITGGEKLDGQNLFVSYSVRDGKAKAARNVGNVKKGGMDADALAAKFAGRGTLEKAFNGAFEAFVDAVQQLPDDVKIKVFGPDANIFYNAEVMDPENPNIINYNTKNLIIHRDGHGEYDRETGKVTDRDVSAEANLLGKALQQIQKSDKEGAFGVEMKAVERLRALSDDTALTTAIARLKKLLADSQVGEGATVGEYIISKLDALVERMFPDLEELTKKMLLQRMFGVKGVTATQIYKTIKDPEVKVAVRDFVKDDKRVKKEIIYPLEDIVHDFAVEMLNGLKSRFVLSHKDEVVRMADKLEQAIADIEATGDEAKIQKLKSGLGKLKSLDKISSSMEGFVFAYDGATYKLTGSFAPVNQIMGLLPWENKRGGDLNEEMSSGERIGLFPGKFKPPHAGHFLGAKEMIDSYDADKVFIIISKKPVKRETEGGLFIVFPEISEKMWNTYIDENGYKGKIIPVVSKYPSPIVDSYEMLKEFPEGTTVLVSKGEKDGSDARFDRMGRFIEKNNIPVKAVQVDGSMSDTGASGTLLGNAIANRDVETFKKMVPLSGSDAMDLWEDIVGQVIDEDFNLFPKAETAVLSEVWQMIDEALEIDNNPGPDGQLGGPASIDDSGLDPDDDEETPNTNTITKGGDNSTTEVEIVTKTVVSVDVKTGKATVVNKVEEEVPAKEIMREVDVNADRGVIDLEDGLGISRNELPQIKSTDVPEFIEWLETQNIESFDASFPVGALKPVQREINLEKVFSMAEKHKAGEIDLSKGKPLMTSSDEHIIDGHHRWYALRELDPKNEIDIIMIDSSARKLIELMKEFPKTSYKQTTDENLYEASYGKIGGDKEVVNVGKMKIVIDIEDMELEPSKHGEERRSRHGQGKTISKDSILQAAERGLGLIIQDYANGEISNGEAFVIRHKANAKTPALNLVGALEMRKGPDTMKIITVMRKDDFKTDNFGGGQQKTYNV